MLRLYSLSHLDSWKPMKILARTGTKREPIATYPINLIIKLLKIKWVCDVVKRKKFLSSFDWKWDLLWYQWNSSKRTSYIVGKKKCSGKICILNVRNSSIVKWGYQDSPKPVHFFVWKDFACTKVQIKPKPTNKIKLSKQKTTKATIFCA